MVLLVAFYHLLVLLIKFKNLFDLKIREKMESLRKKLIEEAKKKLKEVYTRDKILIYSTALVEDLEKITNLLYERLVSLYSIYFPEIFEELSDIEKVCKAINVINKEKINETKKNLEIFGKEKANRIIEKLISTKGVDLTERDLNEIKNLSNLILDLIKEKERIENFNDMLVKEVAPNLSEVGGPKIAAKLIEKAGGLKKLANFPSSTVQVLGAEKALFKHLRKKTKPPKHGIIFQHPEVRGAKKELRGKISRLLAAKLSIAAKLDYYSKKFMGKELKKDLEEKIKKIKGG
jgi:nucleolar protein 56